MSTNPTEFEELKALVLDNNRILKSLESRAKWITIVGLIKWFVYIGIVVGMFAFLKPFYERVYETYSGVQQAADVINQGKEATSSQIQGFLNLISN